MTIAGVGVGGYNGTFTITAVPTPRTFQYTMPAADLANSGGGTATYFSPFQVRIGGNDSALIGGSGLPYNEREPDQPRSTRSPGFAGTATVTGAASTGFTVTYTGASAGVDVPEHRARRPQLRRLLRLRRGDEPRRRERLVPAQLQRQRLRSDHERRQLHGGRHPGRADAAPAGGWHRDRRRLRRRQRSTTPASRSPTQARSPRRTSRCCSASRTSPPGASGFAGETDKGGAVDNKGTITPTGNTFPIVTAPAGFTIPLRTPFALTGSATDAEGDTIVYSLGAERPRRRDRARRCSTTRRRTARCSRCSRSRRRSARTDTLLYNSPDENHLTTSPTRVFPDLEQILDNNTNAETGACPPGPIAPPVPIPVKECFSEFLPTSDYVGFAASTRRRAALPLHGARPAGGGGNSAADTTLTLAPNAGPFLVTAPNTAVTYPGGSTQTVTWDKANTDIPPISATDVKISLSTDGGLTYPNVLAASTANDGSEAVTIPNVATTQRPREDRGGRQRLLRRLERELHDRRQPAATASAASTSTATAATTAATTATTASAAATAATAAATSASAATAGALSRAERDRPEAGNGEGTDPGTALPGRHGAQGSLPARRPCRRPEPTGRRGTAASTSGSTCGSAAANQTYETRARRGAERRPVFISAHPSATLGEPRGHSSVGRAPGSHPGGRRFEPG